MSPSAVSQGNDSSPRIFVPALLIRWPYPPRINPHYDVVERESAAWIESFGAFSQKAQHAFNVCNFARLSSLAYATTMKKEHLRVACDFMNLSFVIDQYSDVSEPSEIQKQRDVVMDAFCNPHKQRPEGEWIGGEIARQFWEYAVKIGISKESQKRFIASYDDVFDCLVQEANDRNGHRVRNVESYLSIRRHTIGVYPSFALLQMAFDIPDEVISHPMIEEMVLACSDMIILTNDMISYNIEQSIGHNNHNIIVIVMNEFGTDVNGAMLWLQDYHTKVEQRFHVAMAALPQWEEPLNSQVREYCDGLGNWVRANDTWHFETPRYLGDSGSEIMEKGWISLLPKRGNRKLEAGPVLVDASLLS